MNARPDISTLPESARLLGRSPPENVIVFNGERAPSEDTLDRWLFDVEREATAALRLEPGERLRVVERIRVFDGHPLILHTAYFNPRIVGTGPFEQEDFAGTDLMSVLEAAGFERLPHRPRRFFARPLDPGEKIDVSRHVPTPSNTGNHPPQMSLVNSGVILEVRQLTYARNRDGEVVPLEYLHGRYAHWPYFVPPLASPDEPWFAWFASGEE